MNSFFQQKNIKPGTSFYFIFQSSSYLEIKFFNGNELDVDCTIGTSDTIFNDILNFGKVDNFS
jgi:hypothetical protein